MNEGFPVMLDLIADSWQILSAGGPLMLALFLLASAIYWLAVDTLRRLYNDALSPQQLRLELHTAALVEQWRLGPLQFLRDRKSLLQVLITAAPLLGLLGTVMGMLATFKGLNVSNGDTIDRVAAGISEAMITTETGLLIAIPASILVMFIGSRINALDNCLQRLPERQRHTESASIHSSGSSS